MKTERDSVSIHSTLEALKRSVKAFKELPEDRLREEFKLKPDSRDWKIANAKADVIENDDPSCYTRISYRPFDTRHIWYSGRTRGFVGTPGFPVMRHMLESGALGLLGMRQYEYDVPDYCYVFVSRQLIDNRVFVSNRGIANIFPLYIKEDGDADQPSLLPRLKPNLRPSFLRQLFECIGVRPDASSDFPADLTPETILQYAYAILHSSTYRKRYAELLKIAFPRLPLPRTREVFDELANLGERLIASHLMESPAQENPASSYFGPGNPKVGRVGWSDNTVWLDAAKTNAREYHEAVTPGTMGFGDVSKEVWSLHIGGYQVCHKWLKDRRGRTLAEGDILHYQRILVALEETIRLTQKIDEAIEAHGGWPGAF